LSTQRIAWPVILGAITTFISVSGLMDAPSEGYRVFFVILSGVLVLGIYHGLVIIPVLLITSDQLTSFICSSEPSKHGHKKSHGVDKLPEGAVLAHRLQPGIYYISPPMASMPPNGAPLPFVDPRSEPLFSVPYQTSSFRMPPRPVFSKPVSQSPSLRKYKSELRVVRSCTSPELCGHGQVRVFNKLREELQNTRVFLPRLPIHPHPAVLGTEAMPLQGQTSGVRTLEASRTVIVAGDGNLQETKKIPEKDEEKAFRSLKSTRHSSRPRRHVE
jgi:hypothetical protein